MDQALALIDEAGLDGFSIRKLGARLGVEPMALYHHFPSRPAVLAAVAARVLAAAPLPAVDGGWRGWCGQAARG
ncbi:MAG: helix-turn-helix transcriptional regulator, partial [Alphaproteobacteria bacterium]|nr:helix-turn-helix transcriptional regulator [Alphaproteobacteria bacterium]